MMIERASGDLARRIATGLDLPWGAASEALVDSCESLGVPLITGWDVAAEAPLYKLYANASDLATDVQEKLRARLGIDAPDAHIIGLNVSRAGVRTKLYVQRARFDELSISGVPEVFSAIDGLAWVVAWDLEDPSGPRAVFVAPTRTGAALAERAISSLARVSWVDIARALPFPPGPVRQLGWSPTGAVTVYAKHQGQTGPSSLLPVAVFRAGEAEIGLHLDASDATSRAFLRTDRGVLSYRVRQGAPDSAAIDSFRRWLAGRVLDTDRADGMPDLEDPPAPWQRVGSVA